MLFTSICLGSGVASLGSKVINTIVPKSGRYISAIIFFLIIYSTFIIDYIPINLLGSFSKYRNAGLDDIALRTISKSKIFLGLTIYHLILSILLIDSRKRGNISVKIQEEFWGVKIIVLMAIIGTCFYFTPIKLLSWFIKVSWCLSFLYILIQNVLTIDLVYTNAYKLGQVIVSNWKSGVYLVAFVILLAFSVAIGFIGIDLYRYNTNLLIVITCWSMLIFHAFTSILSTLPYIQAKNEQAGLYQSSLIATYTMSMMSDAFSTYISGSKLFTSVGYLTLILSYAAFSMGSSSDKIVPDLEEGSNPTKASNCDITYNMSFFNLMFGLAATYAMLVFTNWSFIYLSDDNSFSSVVQNDKMSFYSKYFAAASLSLMYLWSLIAPILFPQREFD
jgi:serine incorporator 1/3